MMELSLYIIFALIVIIASITPYITRKTESFGVSIPSDYYHHPIPSRFRKHYFSQSFILGIVFTILFLFIEGEMGTDRFVIVYTVGIFMYLILTFFVYYRYHRQMKQLKEKENWKEKKKEVVAVDIQFYKKKKTYSNIWFIIPLIITIATAVWLLIRFEDIPEKIPMQYNLDGEVVNWMEKSVGTILLFPLIQFFLIGLFLFINIVIERSKQQTDPANPKDSIQKNMIFRKRWSLFTIVSSTALVLIFSIPPISFLYPIDSQILFVITMAITISIVIGALLLAVTTGQGGSRIKSVNGGTEEFMNRDDDRYWKLGQFYFNPEDPAVWVEKRFGVGWTVNFARPIAWIILILIVAVPILITILLV
ncbi:DUF1648 domain-containing protein [Fervidibacillus halotolerans]|uniref:DUF5808 domain-containing protein n=1 Tax=Fervidibacillus halotolerans TaxID=2980027 RepID=A0A9E8M085_9BACI|nr:DUF5808 domain-containing protein [Fervidibacillus halotolerans]WAA12236.1 DUF5808 domain-containing protein [Fervidibacillus halotolerans]